MRAGAEKLKKVLICWWEHFYVFHKGCWYNSQNHWHATCRLEWGSPRLLHSQIFMLLVMKSFQAPSFCVPHYHSQCDSWEPAPFCLPWQAWVCTTGTQGWRCGFEGKTEARVGGWKGKDILVGCSQKQVNWGLRTNRLGRQQITSRWVTVKMERRGCGLCHDLWVSCPLLGMRPLGLTLTQTLLPQANNI